MKNILLFLLFSIVSLPLVNAQTTVQIGTGTSSPNNTLYSPVYRYSATSATNSCQSNILFTAAEMSTAGIPNGATITAVAFNKTTAFNFLIPANFSMLMANTSNTPPLSGTIATQWPSILTSHSVVYTDNSFNIPATTGWATITLNTPFVYTGGSLEIATDMTMTAGGTGATGNFAWEYTPGFDTYIIGATSGNSNLSTYKQRPNIQITYTSGPPCNAPTGVTASAITAGGASFSWTAVTGATGYEYAINTSATPPASGTQQPGTTYNASGLNQGTNYYFHVRTNCSPTNSSGWTTIPFTTLTCTAPGTLTSSAVTSNSASFSWGAVSGAQGYEYVLTNNSTPPTGSGTATTATNYTAINLTDNTNYCLHVRTECSAGVYSSWVNTCVTTPVAPPCAGPDTLDVTNITATTANLWWNSVAGVTDYEYAITTSAAPPASGTFISGNTYNATGLMSNTQYYAHVRDTCSGGLTSPWKTEPFHTPYPPCDPPVATVSNVTHEEADITWGVMPEALRYQVAVFSNANPPSVSGIPTTGTSYHATNLVSGKLYYVHVRSICSFDTSSWATTTFYSATPQSVTTVGTTSGISVYPNPVNDMLYLSLPVTKNGVARIIISDITGRVIKEINTIGNQLTVPTKEWSKGVYTVAYIDNNKKYIIKIVKQ